MTGRMSSRITVIGRVSGRRFWTVEQKLAMLRDAFGSGGCLQPFGCLPRQALRINCTAIGEYMAQPGKTKTHRFQYIDCAITVLNIGGVDENEDQKSTSVGENVALATSDLLSRIITPNPAAFRGFDALASLPRRRPGITPAVGEASRPSISRRFITSKVLIVSNSPAFRQA